MKVALKTQRTAKAHQTPKAGKYIAPRRPQSSGGEGAVSTYTPPARPSSAGGEGAVAAGYTPIRTTVAYGGA